MTLSGSDSRWPTPTRTMGDSNTTRTTGGASAAEEQAAVQYELFGVVTPIGVRPP